MARPLPLVAFCMYVIEKHNQSVYKEDCLWLMASSKMADNKRHLLKRPYMRHSEPKQIKNAPCRTEKETLDYIFEGVG